MTVRLLHGVLYVHVGCLGSRRRREVGELADLVGSREDTLRLDRDQVGRRNRPFGVVLQPRRPGGEATKITDTPVTKGRFIVKGRRGV